MEPRTKNCRIDTERLLAERDSLAAKNRKLLAEMGELKYRQELVHSITSGSLQTKNCRIDTERLLAERDSLAAKNQELLAELDGLVSKNQELEAKLEDLKYRQEVAACEFAAELEASRAEAEINRQHLLSTQKKMQDKLRTMKEMCEYPFGF